MASYTPNINLKKPTTSEYYNVLDENSNKDKIDTAIGTLNSQIAGLIVGVSTPEAIQPGASATIPYPTGFTMQNTQIVYSTLYLSANVDRYPTAVEVQTISSDGIHVKNTGGAAGRIILGLTMT